MERIRRWKWASANLGVATGRESGLVVIDVDPRNGGTENIDRLQKELGPLPPAPVVRTGGAGLHFYFRHPEGPVSKTIPGAAGIDIKSDGGYVVAPPSVHASGRLYTWQASPEDIPLPELPESWMRLLAADARATAGHATESTEDNGGVLKQGSARGVPASAPAENRTGDFDDIILNNLPTVQGTRNRQVFQLARAFKAHPALADAPADSLRPLVRRWHELGVARGVIATEPFEETWTDFLLIWTKDKVKFPKGSEPMFQVLEAAKRAPLPPAASRYEQEPLRQLVAMCRELQRVSADRPFFLACRTAGRLLGVHYVTAWRWLFLLTQDQPPVLLEVEKGSSGKRRASRYRYVGDQASGGSPIEAASPQPAPGSGPAGIPAEGDGSGNHRAGHDGAARPALGAEK